MCYAIPEIVDYTQVWCPVAEQACSTDAVWILQHGMLGDRADMEGFVEAVLKVQRSVTI
jgi:shikimate 5-dehydrogenase